MPAPNSLIVPLSVQEVLCMCVTFYTGKVGTHACLWGTHSKHGCVYSPSFLAHGKTDFVNMLRRSVNTLRRSVNTLRCSANGKNAVREKKMYKQVVNVLSIKSKKICQVYCCWGWLSCLSQTFSWLSYISVDFCHLWVWINFSSMINMAL